ncbi:MAG: ribosomal L7Ae/L30e/S12e/Gadd45 family protein [Nitrososphaerales archaeon]
MTELDEKLLQKALKTIVKTGKYTLGLKEGTKSLKSVKMLVYSDSLEDEIVSKIERACKRSSVPTIAYPGSSVALGRLCGKPFRVSVVSVRSTGDMDITPLINK